MARRKTVRRGSLSPINPSINFVLFLILALFLVIIVAGLMQKTSQNVRAWLACPDNTNATKMFDKRIESQRSCPNTVKLMRDKDGCFTWQCPLPQSQ